MSHKTNAELGKALADLANQTGEQFAEVTLNVADLATKLAALEPLSCTVRTLEAYVHEGAEQVHTLNLAISRLERHQLQHQQAPLHGHLGFLRRQRPRSHALFFQHYQTAER